MRIVMLGRPGAGKGTQVERVAGLLGVTALSTSALLREAVAASTPLAHHIDRTMRSGGLVPDDVVISVVTDAVRRTSGPLLLDGFPRTVFQCESLQRELGYEGIDLALELSVSPAEVLARVRRRRVCASCGILVAATSCPRCGATPALRADDEPEVVLRRLWTYELETRPVLDWYARRGLLVSINGSGPVDLVTARVLAAIEGPGTVVSARG